MIHQGHKYKYFGQEVIAIEPYPGNDGSWWVKPISLPWMLEARRAYPDQLQPLPMKYFHGQVPDGA